jgi:hypothetical protein
MAQVADGRTPETVRHEIEQEREQLADAVEELREGLGEVADITGKLRAKLPVVAVGALGAGFVFAGGIGATMRMLARRGREGRERVKVGRFALVDRD